MTAADRRSAPSPAAEEHRYEFSVALDTSATNAYQGDNSVVPFTWDAA